MPSPHGDRTRDLVHKAYFYEVDAHTSTIAITLCPLEAVSVLLTGGALPGFPEDLVTPTLHLQNSDPQATNRSHGGTGFRHAATHDCNMLQRLCTANQSGITQSLTSLLNPLTIGCKPLSRLRLVRFIAPLSLISTCPCRDRDSA